MTSYIDTAKQATVWAILKMGLNFLENQLYQFLELSVGVVCFHKPWIYSICAFHTYPISITTTRVITDNLYMS